MNTFIFEETTYDKLKEKSKAAAFTIGNGFYGCRGFHEESQDEITKLGGIYQAGLFGQGVHEAYDGSLITELLNTPNVLRIKLVADGQVIDLNTIDYEDFYQRLDLANGLYQRGYKVNLKSGKKLVLTFERLAHLTYYHLLGQQLTFQADGDVELQLTTYMDASVTNLNLESTEPWPIQPGRRHLSVKAAKPNRILSESDYKQSGLCQLAKEHLQLENYQHTQPSPEDELAPENDYRFTLKKNQQVKFERIIASTHSVEETNYQKTVVKYLAEVATYRELKESQKEAWQKVWKICDVKLKGADDLQITMRYNLFQLYSAAPRHTHRLSIGARGLSGEMYEGCVFWDLEIFKLPFFIHHFPEEAKKLLHFRYHTLQQAKIHAKANLFEGAFFPWQVSAEGIEQTPKNVGAFYAIHIVSDIAYGINKYLRMTEDQEAFKEFMAELLIETSRFFVSRVSYSSTHKGYEILAVRGPNEYDVIVNNNCYTNTLAAENLRLTVELLSKLAVEDPKAYQEIQAKTSLTILEIARFNEVAKNIWIPKDQEQGLYLEDEKYLARREIPITLLKPTAKRVIDSTLPYEALPLYQITKQADVVQMMNLLPENYTEEEKKQNFDFYLQRTVHDSSLSMCGYGLMAARLGIDEISMEMFRKASFFDIQDHLLNTISGLHYANFGGVWQIAVLGFFGVEVSAKSLQLLPHLPVYLEEVSTKIYYLGNQLELVLTRDQLKIKMISFKKDCSIKVLGTDYCLKQDGKIIHDLKKM